MSETPPAQSRPSEHPAPSAPGSDLGGPDLLNLGAAEPTRADLLARVALLEGRLVSLPQIEQAKGALMLAYGLSAQAAFAVLRFHSQHRNVKIRSIAAELTTLMATSPSSTEAIGRFNRLLDQAAEQLADPAARTIMPGVHTDTSRSDTPPPLPAPKASDPPDLTIQAVAVAPPGITIAGNDHDQPLVYANHAFTEITGFPAEDVLGRNCRFLQGPDTDPDKVAVLGRSLRFGREVSVVIRNYRSDGSPFWNEVSVSPIRNQVGQITHFIGTQIDLTPSMDPAHASIG